MVKRATDPKGVYQRVAVALAHMDQPDGLLQDPAYRTDWKRYLERHGDCFKKDGRSAGNSAKTIADWFGGGGTERGWKRRSQLYWELECFYLSPVYGPLAQHVHLTDPTTAAYVRAQFDARYSISYKDPKRDYYVPLVLRADARLLMDQSERSKPGPFLKSQLPEEYKSTFVKRMEELLDGEYADAADLYAEFRTKKMPERE
jgi:hypothetical protein